LHLNYFKFLFLKSCAFSISLFLAQFALVFYDLKF